MARYEIFRRSHLNPNGVKRVLEKVIPASECSNEVVIAFGGAAKLFAGEIVEMAREVMEQRQEKGQIQPRHLREAYRRLSLDGKI